MPTNRPFFANFLAAFRAHNALTNTPTANPTTNPQTTFTYPTSPQQTRAITIPTKSPPSPTPGATTAAVNAASHLSHTRSPSATNTARQATSPPATVSRSPPQQQGWRAQRRGSDSSSDTGGFREVLGAEKWYVGGRTAGGEERFLRLGVVRKGSGGRGSVDRLSL